ncbi:ATP-binding cassette domain-containing protein [Immundisolibacter sp.]
MNSSPAIAVENLSFEYPGVRALSEVSFCIEPASVTALVGPNGAGKSTLLRCIAGLDWPLLGSIELAGVDMLEQPRLAHRRLGFLADFYGLNDALSVRWALTYMAAAHGAGRARHRRHGAAHRQAPRNRRPAGTALRRTVARPAPARRHRPALVHSPPVLLLDEPAAGLDPQPRHVLARLFARLRDGGMTLLVSSHILAELDEYSNHMLVLRGGQLIEHRALTGGAAGPVRPLRLGFVSPVLDLAAMIAGISGIRVLENADRDALLELTGNDRTQADALRMLVERGLPLTRFAQERENLHASYLHTIGSGAAS